ncbi:MAG: spore protease YyaC [Clostridia bacterium]|nr:spore protease YyaC [Clostridia bacterium]
MEYSFHLYNKLAADGAAMALDKLLNTYFYQKNQKTKGAGTSLIDFYPTPVVVCVGSDLAIGDSLGPITGSMLKYKTQGLNVFLYGTLSSPVTAKEIKHLRAFLKETHRNSPIIAVDAAVGEKGDIGLIRLSDSPLLPGAGANKKLGAVGDISIMGIVAEKSMMNYGLLNTTRLNLVYSMSEIISDALSSLLWNRGEKEVKNA